MAAWEICPACRSVVANIALHDEWHNTGLRQEVALVVDDITTTPNEALEG